MRFPSFMPSGRQVCDAKTHTEVLEVLLALSCESIEEVDGWVERPGGAGGGADVGFKGEMRSKEGVIMMCGRDFDDLDGHVWEVVWMREGAVERVEGLRE